MIKWEAIMKKLFSRMLALSLALSILFSGNSITPVNAATNLKSIYTKYIKQELKKDKNVDTLTCYMYDFNKDGVKEFITCEVGGARASYRVYTYKDGKVKYLTSGNRIGYIKGKKYLVSYGSGGADYFLYDVYKISGGKSKLVTRYACEYSVYKKDNTEISRNEFDNFSKTVVCDLGKGFEVSEYNYYSAEQIGFSLSEVWNSGEIKIDKVTKDKITYHTEKWDWSEDKLLSKGKTKTAKITKDTKFYYGNTTLCFSEENSKLTLDQRKWLQKISKSKFLDIMKTYKGMPNIVKVKNGKAECIAIHIQIAG